MSWAARRRFIIALIVGAVAVVFLTVVSTKIFYTAPSCTDGSQNQGESGVDCGGSCAYLCTAQLQPPTVLFTKALTTTEGRTDIIAEVENKNIDAAAKNVPYRIALYDAGQVLIQEIKGTLDLPPGMTTPVYIPRVASGKQVVARAFLTIDPFSPKWFSLTSIERSVPLVSNITLGGATSTPRIEAVLTNPTANVFTNVQTIVFVHSEQKEVIAASMTVVPRIPPQGQATATFTWNSAFSNTPTSIEVVPIIPLP